MSTISRLILEHFPDFKKEDYKSAANFPPRLYKQHRDWTCAFACCSTLLSGITKHVPAENDLIEKYNLSPGPYYTKDIKGLRIFEDFCDDIIYGTDIDPEILSVKYLQSLLEDRYFVMVQCSYNVSHWLVLLGYCAEVDFEDIEKHKLIVYDPWFDCVRTLIAAEFAGMWGDQYGHKKEFIAIRKTDTNTKDNDTYGYFQIDEVLKRNNADPTDEVRELVSCKIIYNKIMDVTEDDIEKMGEYFYKTRLKLILKRMAELMEITKISKEDLEKLVLEISTN